MPEVRVKSEIAGSVWKVLKRPGDAVAVRVVRGGRPMDLQLPIQP